MTMESIVWIMIGSVSAIFLLGFLLISCWSRRAVSDKSPSFVQEKVEDELGNGVEQLMYFQGCEQLTIDDILNASGEVLGKSSYGTVYKARLLTDGGMIALRLLRDSCIRKPDEFLDVIQELGYIRHSHLVAILAFYAGSMGEKLLVYEYLPRGNLAELLQSKCLLYSIALVHFIGENIILYPNLPMHIYLIMKHFHYIKKFACRVNAHAH